MRGRLDSGGRTALRLCAIGGDVEIPAEFEILAAHRLVVSRYSATLTPAETAESCIAYYGGPEFDPRYSHLFDLGGVTHFDFDFGQMMRLVSRLEKLYNRRDEDTRSVLLAPGDVAFGIARMYQSLLSDRVPFAIGVYRCRTEALRFLGLGAEAEAAIWGGPAPLRAAGPWSP